MKYCDFPYIVNEPTHYLSVTVYKLEEKYECLVSLSSELRNIKCVVKKLSGFYLSLQRS